MEETPHLALSYFKGWKHNYRKLKKDKMIALYNVKVFDKKGTQVIQIEVVGSTKEAMQSDPFYQKRVLRNAGCDLKTEKWSDLSRYRFEATLLKTIES